MEEKRAYKGGALNIIGDMFDAHMRGCERAIAENPELVIMYDLESGFPYTTTKEYRDSYLRMWESIMPNPTPELQKGKLFIFGTGGDMDKGSSDFRNMFYGKKE